MVLIFSVQLGLILLIPAGIMVCSIGLLLNNDSWLVMMVKQKVKKTLQQMRLLWLVTLQLKYFLEGLSKVQGTLTFKTFITAHGICAIKYSNGW